MLPSQTPDTFKGRYNRGILKGKFSFDSYIKNKELQELLAVLGLDAEKFWYLLLFCYDCSWGKCMEGIEIKESPKEQIENLLMLSVRIIKEILRLVQSLKAQFVLR